MSIFRKAAYKWGFEDGREGAQFIPDNLNSMDEEMLMMFRGDYRRGYLAGKSSADKFKKETE